MGLLVTDETELVRGPHVELVVHDDANHQEVHYRHVGESQCHHVHVELALRGSVRDDDGRRARDVFEEKDAHLVHLKTRNSTLELLRPGKGCLRNSYPMRNL